MQRSSSKLGTQPEKNASLKVYFKVPITGVSDFQKRMNHGQQTSQHFLDYLSFLIIQATPPLHYSAVTYIYGPSEGL
jgi:hypothetical protein